MPCFIVCLGSLDSESVKAGSDGFASPDPSESSHGLPFSWEDEEGLVPEVDQRNLSNIKPSYQTRKFGGIFSTTYGGFSSLDAVRSPLRRLKDSTGTYFVSKFGLSSLTWLWISKTIKFLILTVLILCPVYVSLYVLQKEPHRESVYGKYWPGNLEFWENTALPLAFMLEISVFLWIYGRLLHYMTVRYAHDAIAFLSTYDETLVYDATHGQKGLLQKPRHRPGIYRFLRSNVFHILLAASGQICLTIYVGMLAVASIYLLPQYTLLTDDSKLHQNISSLDSAAYLVLPLPHLSTPPVSNSTFFNASESGEGSLFEDIDFGYFIHRMLLIFLCSSAMLSLEKIWMAKIIGTFFQTAYSKRLIDFLDSLKAVKVLVSSLRKGLCLEDDHFRRSSTSAGIHPSVGENKGFNHLEGPGNTSYFILSMMDHVNVASIPTVGIHEELQSVEQLLERKSSAKILAKMIFVAFFDLQCRKNQLERLRSPNQGALKRGKMFKNLKQPVITAESSIQADLFRPYFSTARDHWQFIEKINSMSHALSSHDYSRSGSDLNTGCDQDKDASRITPLKLKRYMVELHREKISLVGSLFDHGKAVAKLEHLAFLLTLFVSLLLAPWLFGLGFGRALTSVLGIIAGCSFMFKDSCSSLFNSIIFLFITHPFDIGDRVLIDNDAYFVHEIRLFSTVLMRWDGFMVYYPNAVLLEKGIVNVRRSKSQMQEFVNILVDSQSTTSEKLKKLDESLVKFFADENSHYYLQPMRDVPSDPLTFSNSGLVDAMGSAPPMEDRQVSHNYRVLRGIELVESRHLRLVILLKHKSNFQDGALRLTRHVLFMEHLKKSIQELGIVFVRAPITVVSSISS